MRDRSQANTNSRRGEDVVTHEVWAARGAAAGRRGGDFRRAVSGCCARAESGQAGGGRVGRSPRAGSRGPLGQDLGLCRDRAARAQVGGRAGGLRRAAGIQGRTRRRGPADRVHGDVRFGAPDHRDPRRVRRVARNFAESHRGEIAAGRGRGRPRLRSQPVRRREPRRRDRHQGADRRRQAEGYGPVLRDAGGRRRRRKDLHGARRPVRRPRRSTRLAPWRRDGSGHGFRSGHGRPWHRVPRQGRPRRQRPVEWPQRGRRRGTVHARREHDARARQADLAHPLRDRQRRRRAERRSGIREGLAVGARLEA